MNHDNKQGEPDSAENQDPTSFDRNQGSSIQQISKANEEASPFDNAN